MDKLIQQLIDEGHLKTKRIIKAFQKIKREDFVPKSLTGEAVMNYPLPIGFGQTISQPLTVAFMLELLQPEPGDKILDIGSGSGWTTALLAAIVGPKGKVFGIELLSELKEFGEENIKKYNFVEEGRVKFICTDGSKGLKNEAPFDKIQVAAAAAHTPKALLEQLKIGGKLVIPIGIGSQEIVVIKKMGEDKYQEKRFPGFVFVPLIEK